MIARNGRREEDEPVLGQGTYVSIYKVSKLLGITPNFLSLFLPLKLTSSYIFQIKLNIDDGI